MEELIMWIPSKFPSDKKGIIIISLCLNTTFAAQLRSMCDVEKVLFSTFPDSVTTSLGRMFIHVRTHVKQVGVN